MTGAGRGPGATGRDDRLDDHAAVARGATRGWEARDAAIAEAIAAMVETRGPKAILRVSRRTDPPSGAEGLAAIPRIEVAGVEDALARLRESLLGRETADWSVAYEAPATPAKGRPSRTSYRTLLASPCTMPAGTMVRLTGACGGTTWMRELRAAEGDRVVLIRGVTRADAFSGLDPEAFS